MGCRKAYFTTRVVAKLIAKKLKGGGCKGKLRVYKCEWCEGFHLTSADAEQSKEIREKMLE